MPPRIFRNCMLIMFFFVFNQNANSQKFFLETGLSTAYFKDYTNNLGTNTLDLNYSKPKKPFVEAGFRFNIYNERIEWDLAANYSTYQINTAFASGNIKIPMEYELNYAAVKTGVNLTVIDWKKIKLQLHSHFSYDWLTYGTNTYNNQVVNIYKERTLDRTLLRYHRGAAIQYEISNSIATYLNYNLADSFKEKNKDSNNGENYVLRTNSASIGLLFRIDEFKTFKK